MTEAREIDRAIAAATGTLASAGSLDAALEALASLLSERFTISRISVRTYVAETDEVEIAGVWSARPTHLDAGIRVPARSTSFVGVERRCAATLVPPPGTADPLLDQIVKDEGNRSWVATPLRGGHGVVGVLSVSSADVDGFTEADLPFFDALAIALEERLLELAPA
jgi:GAF domain-containing protein